LDLLQPIHFDDFRLPVERVWGGLAFLASPIFQPSSSGLRGQAVFPDLNWFSSQYGKICTVRVVAVNDRAARLEYWPVPLPSAQDVIPYESEVRTLLRRTPYALSDLLCSVKESRQRYAGMLFDIRLEQLRQVRFWLIDYLRILGIDPPYPDLNEFVFPIKGMPAQFGVLAREITSRSTTLFGQKINCQVRKPGSIFEFGSIPPDVNPLEVRLSVEKARLEIRASSLPEGATLLGVSNLNGHREWEIWGLLRDEMERLQCFNLPVVSQEQRAALAEVEESLALQIPDMVVSQPWLHIPDVGDSREMVRLWHNNLTCKEIAVRLGCTEKTIINKINLLRNQYGQEIVPYRRTIGKKIST
jgi:hypothetical protein